MNKNPALEFVTHTMKATAILEEARPTPNKKKLAIFLRRVADALTRHPEQAEVLSNKDTGREADARATDLAKHLKRALQVLQRMDEGTETVIHQHFQLNENTRLPQTRFPGPVEGTLRGLIQAVASHRETDLTPSSKLKPCDRRHMPLLFHVGQAWVECYWNEARDNNNGFPISKRDNSTFYKFVNFLVCDVVGDEHQKIESLITLALRDDLLPKPPGK